MVKKFFRKYKPRVGGIEDRYRKIIYEQKYITERILKNFVRRRNALVERN